MRQDEDVEFHSRPGGAVPAADQFRESALAENDPRGEGADTEHELRTKQSDLPVQVSTAALDLIPVRDSIAARRGASGKATDYRGNVNGVAKAFLVHTQVREPGEQPAPRGVGEGAPLVFLTRAGGLSHEQDPAAANGSAHRRSVDGRARPAGEQGLEVPLPGIGHVRVPLLSHCSIL